MKPKVSVIIPTYNKPNLLVERAVPSLLRQTYSNFECIIVDDCSSDNTWEVLQKLKGQDPRLVTFHFEERRGVSAAVNYGIRKSQGEFIAMLEQDDEYYPTFLEEAVAALEQLPQEYGAVGCGVKVVLEGSRYHYYAMPSLADSFYISMSVGWLWRREVFFEGGIFFDEELSSDADTDFGIRFFEKYKAKILPKTLFVKYVRQNVFDKDGLSVVTPRRLKELERFIEKDLHKIEAKGSKREKGYIYRRIGRLFLLSGMQDKGIKFVKKAFFTQPNLYNFVNLIFACGGRHIYRYFFYFERRLIFLVKKLSGNK